MTDYRTELELYKDDVNAELEKRFSAYTDNSRVVDAMRYSLLGSGKRVRGALCLAVCELICSKHEAALPAASAVEMLHCYSLIHDDLPCMDDDDMRRGKPSCHKAFGEATAMLAGDGLLTLSFETLCDISDANAFRGCVKRLSSAAGAMGMIRGQELDLEIVQIEDPEARLYETHRNKTGEMINAAAVMGALCAGANERQIKTVSNYADGLGLVFQIIDDILDCTATDESLGKPVGSDAKQGKLTFASHYGLETAFEKATLVTDEIISGIKREFGDDGEFLITFAKELLSRKS